MSNETRILPDMSELLARLAALEADNAKLRTQANTARRVTFKVTEKGAVSLYGLGRFPVTLYLSQWEALLAHADQLKTYLDANRAVLATKTHD